MRKTALLTASIILLTATSAGLSIQDDIPPLTVVFKDETQVYNLKVENTGNQTRTLQINPSRDIQDIVEVQNSVTLSPGQVSDIIVRINGSRTGGKGLRAGRITVTDGQVSRDVAVAVRLMKRENAEIKVDLQTTSDRVRPLQGVNALTVLSSGSEGNTTGRIVYSIRRAASGVSIFELERNVSFNRLESFTQELDPAQKLSVGEYYVQARLDTSDNRTYTATDTFRTVNPFWTPTRIKVALFIVVGSIIIGGGFYTQRWYQNYKEDEARYVFPVDYNKLPSGEEDRMFEVGKVAETEKTAYIDPKDLTTHAIVAGSTGSGKSVTANVVAEEALENDIPVVVFDPTAQWTGFVKELKDENVEEHYDRFDMDTETDEHPYPGIIKEVKGEDPDIDFQQLKQPGEITVFTLNKLTTEQFDQAVRKIIDQIFEIEWEESSTLEMLVIFDEVHRLLEKYGGEGGYHALERGAREFRKWGIGLMMCSQVTADFKQAISGNIMTEIQMQTKSMEDIDRIEKKYGEQFAKRISSEDIGTGMIQNSNYNEGDPWFVDFRPTYHNPHKIPDEELEKYHKLSAKLDEVREELDKREEQGEDVRDKRLELQLAEDKLKEGRFKMANMYIDSLKDEMDMS
ncbi:MAG: helicase HerA-like domain-containing protein [Candidatus Nanohalobium sp.]